MNKEDIENMIVLEVEEDLHLDYKSSGSLERTSGKKKEVTKDVSAFANSDGGRIIYGISEYQDDEKSHLPEKIDPIVDVKITKEWLEQVIGGIQPRISDIKIYPVRYDNGVVFVVDIPKSNTVHQASDKRYYRRYNFASVPMEDFEIRDVMNRSIHPIVEGLLIFKDKSREVVYTRSLNSFVPSGRQETAWEEDYKLMVYLNNIGRVKAMHVLMELSIPSTLLHENEKEDDTDAEYVVRNTNRDVVDVQVSDPLAGRSYEKYGPSWYEPILPGSYYCWRHDIRLPNNYKQLLDERISWRVYADAAQPQEGSISMREIIQQNEGDT